MAGFDDHLPLSLCAYYNLLVPVLFRHLQLASGNSRVVQYATLCTKVLDALAPYYAALVLTRTGWVSPESGVVQTHLSREQLVCTLTKLTLLTDSAHAFVVGEGGHPVLTGDIRS